MACNPNAPARVAASLGRLARELRKPPQPLAKPGTQSGSSLPGHTLVHLATWLESLVRQSVASPCLSTLWSRDTLGVDVPIMCIRRCRQWWLCFCIFSYFGLPRFWSPVNSQTLFFECSMAVILSLQKKRCFFEEITCFWAPKIGLRKVRNNVAQFA